MRAREAGPGGATPAGGGRDGIAAMPSEWVPLRPPPRPRPSLRAALDGERGGGGDGAEAAGAERATEAAAAFVSMLSGEARAAPPALGAAATHVRGGVLGDEMGLGKARNLGKSTSTNPNRGKRVDETEPGGKCGTRRRNEREDERRIKTR